MSQNLDGIKINVRNESNEAIKEEPKQTQAKHIKQKKTAPSQVDFLQEYNNRTDITLPSNGQRIFKSIFLIVLLLIFLFGTLLFSNYLQTRQNDNSLTHALNKLNLWEQLSSIITGVLPTPDDDRTNFLILGMGGAGHDGPFLTDTIIFSSMRDSTSQLSLTSIPRDLVVKYTDSYYPKINEVYTIGRRNDDEPGKFAADIIGDNLGQEIDYYVVVDFNGFSEIIDILGGVTIDVERSFTDTQYPTLDYEYQTVSFEAGPQLMDGDTALKYSRSRHGNNGEGSDFARSRRQQKLLFAIKDKILSYQTLLNPYKLSRLYSSITSHLTTNISLKTALDLFEKLKEINLDDTLQYTIDDSPGGLLQASISEEGAYILTPINGYDSLRQFIDEQFEYSDTASETATISIQNGTTVPGLAYSLSQELRGYNLEIASYENAATQDYQRTIIYNLTDGDKPLTTELLQRVIPYAIMTSSIPTYISEDSEINNVDFIIIIGQDKAYNNQLNQLN
ncbi:MAG: LCP family protein [Candidatus Komeilibacteria bacterium]